MFIFYFIIQIIFSHPCKIIIHSLVDEFTRTRCNGVSPHHLCMLHFRCCFYDYLARRRVINRERMQQRSELRRLFKKS